MSQVAIRVEGLGKRYRLGQQGGYKTLREGLFLAYHTPTRVIGERILRLRQTEDGRLKTETAGLQSPVSGPQSPVPSQSDHIWALKDVSFEVKRGEAVGIIGRNGSGKSTLLKILSRITAPTEGYAEIHGRVGSLLEVGTGFHPELTGRENIYLNAAIIGMKKAEVDRKFDEIVAFAEIEKFLDTPVKRYSSGMYVRLAFAVAAHLEPEVLVVDEVLAVGDAEFQKKCLGKMQDVTGEGRTVLFVSHQMNSIRRLCERCVWLEAGRIKMAGSTGAVVGAYEQSASGEPSHLGAGVDAADAPAKFLQWGIVEPRTEHPNVLVAAGPVRFKVTVRVNTPIRNASHGIALWSGDQQLMWGWVTHNLSLSPGVCEFVYDLPCLPLRPGAYSWQVSLYDEGHSIDEWHCNPQLVVANAPFGVTTDQWSGILNIPCEVRIVQTGS